jgi:deoxyadenosine/deoxycytidine kinase
MLPRAIILVGPDKAGKSTLVAKLRAAFPEMGYRKGLYIKDFAEMQKAVETEIIGLNNTIYPKIFDRFHYPDELIYGSLNREQPLDEMKKSWFELYARGALGNAGTLFIYCHADIETLKQRFIASGETDIKVEWYEQMLKAYDAWFDTLNGTQFGWIRLDSSKLNEEEMFKEVMNYFAKLTQL